MILLILAILISGYLGFYLMLVGGIVQVCNGVKSNPTNSKDVALGMLRVLFSGLVTIISFTWVSMLGIGIINGYNQF